MQATVFIVDDDEALCKSLCWFLESVGLSVLVYGSAEAFLEKFDLTQRGCLVLDVRMPGISGFELQRQLNTLGNQMPIILLTGHGDIPLAVESIKLGALDFITKPFNAQHLLERIQYAIRQDERRPRMGKAEFISKLSLLTPREKQILEYMVDGKLNKQVAIELNISIKTVELHRSNVMQKIGMHSLAEIIRLYYQTAASVP